MRLIFTKVLNMKEDFQNGTRISHSQAITGGKAFAQMFEQDCCKNRTFWKK